MSANPIILGAIDSRVKDVATRIERELRNHAIELLRQQQVVMRESLPVEAFIAATVCYPYNTKETDTAEEVLGKWIREQLETKLANRMLALLDAPEPVEPEEVQP